MDSPLRLRGGLLAVAAIVKDEVQVVSWPVTAFPAAKSLESATSELKPKTVIKVGPSEGGSLHFDLDQTGAVTTLRSPEYLVITLGRWQSGKRTSSKTMKEVDAVDLAVSPDGSRTMVLTREGEVLAFDSKLELVERIKTFTGKKWGSGVRFDPSGSFFVTSALNLNDKGGELAVWDARTLKQLARLSVKEAVQGFRVRDVARGAG